MSTFKTSLLVVFSLGVSVFGQTQEPSNNKRYGKFWHFFESAEKETAELAGNISARNTTFLNLATKTKEGDPNKIKLYLIKLRKAQSALRSSVAGGSDDARNLRDWAGQALLNDPRDILNGGYATEEEYDRAMALVKILEANIKQKDPTQDQRKIWLEALEKIGIDTSLKIPYEYDIN